MIANVSPNALSCEHTLNTLRYADRVKGMWFLLAQMVKTGSLCEFWPIDQPMTCCQTRIVLSRTIRTWHYAIGLVFDQKPVLFATLRASKCQMSDWMDAQSSQTLSSMQTLVVSHLIAKGHQSTKCFVILCMYKCKMTVWDLTCFAFTFQLLDPACSVKSAPRLHAVQLIVTCICGCNLHIRQDHHQRRLTPVLNNIQ